MLGDPLFSAVRCNLVCTIVISKLVVKLLALSIVTLRQHVAEELLTVRELDSSHTEYRNEKIVLDLLS